MPAMTSTDSPTIHPPQYLSHKLDDQVVNWTYTGLRNIIGWLYLNERDLAVREANRYMAEVIAGQQSRN